MSKATGDGVTWRLHELNVYTWKIYDWLYICMSRELYYLSGVEKIGVLNRTSQKEKDR